MRTLNVFLNTRLVGVLSEGADIWNFQYDLGWLNAEDSFDLSPGLPCKPEVHQDGGSVRPVQWYFDNLLPEEDLREYVRKEAKIQGDDAFALLQYLGAESAGSLVLVPPEVAVGGGGGLEKLTDEALSARIKRLPKASLSEGAPKKMSIAGAQHKLLVVYREPTLFEPIGNEPSTHLLKPNHLSEDFASSVINEYLIMTLAGKLGLPVPKVYRKYVPEPTYIIQRFDRFSDKQGTTQRVHIIDACQLLNKSRVFKYQAASLDALKDILGYCRNKIKTRIRLFNWLVFNVLVANHDNHLKNLSFIVGPEGIELSPHYDLLSTGVYNTKALVDDRANWPDVLLAIALPGADTFKEVNRKSLVAAGEALGLTSKVCEREINAMAKNILPAMGQLMEQISKENETLRPDAKRFFGGELMVLRMMQSTVIPEMLARVA